MSEVKRFRSVFTSGDDQKKLDGSFTILETSESGSLLKKHLTRPIFERLKDKKTTFGSTLMDVIQSGIENLDSGVGVYAPDSESYTVFGELFDPIIEDYHGGFTKSSVQPPKTWGDPAIFGNLDPENKFVVSTRVRCGRSIESFPFNPCLNKKQYLEIEKVAKFAFESFQDELKGEYFPLHGMKKDVQKKLIDDHFLFKEGDRFLKSANANRFWPIGRGIFHNNSKTFLIWVNEEDHLRIISMEPGGDLANVYKRLIRGVEQLEKRISFSRHPRFGFLTFCPTNLGTTIRASVHIKLPKLGSDPNKLKEVAEKYKLQIRGTSGEHSESEKGVYDISNKRRLGLTEFEAVQTMNDGIKQLIKIEKSL